MPFISIIIGVCLGAAIITYTTKTRFKRKLEETHHVVPEERLLPMIIGGAFLPIGLFWVRNSSSYRVDCTDILAVRLDKLTAHHALASDC